MFLLADLPSPGTCGIGRAKAGNAIAVVRHRERADRTLRCASARRPLKITMAAVRPPDAPAIVLDERHYPRQGRIRAEARFALSGRRSIMSLSVV